MHLIGRMFKLRRDEYKKSKYLVAMFIFIGFYNTLIESTSLTVFNSRLGPGYFPLVYMMFPFFNLGVSAAFLPLINRLPKQRLFKYFIFAIVGLHLLNFTIVLGIYGFKYVYLFLILSCMLVAENMIFLSMLVLQDFVSIESIKRLLPLATASITSGAVLAALMIKSTSGLIPLWMLHAFVTVMLFGTLYIGEVLYKRYKVFSADSDEIVEGGISETMRHIAENPFFIAVILVSMLVVVTFTVNDYLYNVHATNFFPDERNLFAFIGETEAFQYIAAFMIEVFIFSRVISKIGSANMIKVVIVNIVVSMTMMTGGGQFVVLLMASRIICKEFILEMNYSVAQVFYQPANPRYRETLLVIHNILVGFIGCILGGIVTILHANHALNTLTISLIPVVLSVPAYILWHCKQNGFISVIEKTMNFSKASNDIDIGKLVGEIGLNKLLPYITNRIAKGKASDIIFALEFIKVTDLKEKKELTECAFEKGSIEARMRIIDLYFEGYIPTDALKACIVKMKGTEQEYMLEKLIIEYMDIKQDCRKEIIEEVGRCFPREQLNAYSASIYEYLYEEKNGSYDHILNFLKSAGSNGNLTKLLKIIYNFTSVEDKTNERYLNFLIKELHGRRSILGSLIEAAAYYDCRNWGVSFLKDKLPEYCEYEVIRKASDCYGAKVVMECLSGSNGLTQQLFALYAVRDLDPEAAKDYNCLFERALINLQGVKSIKSNIEGMEGTGKPVLLEEMDRVIQTATAILIDYAFIISGIPLIDNIHKHIASEEKREMVLEMARNLLPSKLADLLLKAVDGENYNTWGLRSLGECTGSQALSTMWKSLTGEELEEVLRKEYERIYMLKSVPLFRALDFDMLHCINRIAETVKFSIGEKVIRKGEGADCFYVVCTGKLGVYLENGDKPVAVLTAGDVAGELAVLDNGLRTADVVCETEAELLVFKGEEITDLLEKNGDIALAFIKMLSDRLRGMLT